MRLLAATALLWVAPLMAQDPPPRPEGVRIGITYAPGSRQALAVLGGGTLAADSARAILARDLDFSDRFEVVVPPAGPNGAEPDIRALAALGTDWVVRVAVADGDVAVQAHEVRSGQVRFRTTVAAAAGGVDRFAVHRAADEIVRAATGARGISATALLLVRDGRLWRVDADGAGARQLRSAGAPALSPAWSPDGQRVVHTAFVASGQPLVIQQLVSGERTVVPSTEYGLNITPEFSPDGRRLAFAHGTEAGTDIYVYDVAEGCCVQRLTTGRFADNLSPTWSPDGTRIAFISTRARTPQLYVMSADGTNQEVLGRFDYGATGATSAPAWSPDGQFVAFHREVGGTPQVFVLDLDARSVRQLTAGSRNEDPTWAPDGRHLAFVSSRSGTRELWIVDVESGRQRQLTALGRARLPAWSPRLGRGLE